MTVHVTSAESGDIPNSVRMSGNVGSITSMPSAPIAIISVTIARNSRCPAPPRSRRPATAGSRSTTVTGSARGAPGACYVRTCGRHGASRAQLGVGGGVGASTIVIVVALVDAAVAVAVSPP